MVDVVARTQSSLATILVTLCSASCQWRKLLMPRCRAWLQKRSSAGYCLNSDGSRSSNGRGRSSRASSGSSKHNERRNSTLHSAIASTNGKPRRTAFSMSVFVCFCFKTLTLFATRQRHEATGSMSSSSQLLRLVQFLVNVLGQGVTRAGLPKLARARAGIGSASTIQIESRLSRGGS